MINYLRNRREIEQTPQDTINVEFNDNLENHISNIISTIKYGEKLEERK